MNLMIREETPDDYEEIYKLVKSAFASAEHCDGDEQDLVERLRASSAYIPQLALVAELDGRLVGYIMFTAIKIGGASAITLAPLAVLPEMQGKGIGGALIKEGHRIAGEMGYSFSVLLGHAAYYPRFGYKMSTEFGIRTHLDVPEENYMAYDVQGGQTRLEGFVEYPEAWGL